MLVIGVGNTLRRDDGVGPVVARLLEGHPRLVAGRVEVREAHQLLPEMALAVGEASLVIFVDADMRGLPGSIGVHALDPWASPGPDADARGEPGASSHHVGAGELVALAAELTGHRAQAVIVGVGVADTELGEGLSPAVEAVLPRIVEVVAELVERHLAGPSA